MNSKLISNYSNFSINIENYITNLNPGNFIIISEETYNKLLGNEYFRFLLNSNSIYCTSCFDNKITCNNKITNNTNLTTTNNDTINETSVLTVEVETPTPIKKQKRGRSRVNKNKE